MYCVSVREKEHEVKGDGVEADQFEAEAVTVGGGVVHCVITLFVSDPRIGIVTQ